jgi:Zn-dependent protease/predicted transcriptional regulator
MRASLRIGRILGIPIYIHVTFLIILPLFAVYFATTTYEVLGFRLGFGGLGLGFASEMILGTLAALIFFASVLAHELAHSYVALRHGYKISGITLFIFGGVSQIEETPPQAPGEALMAFLGPASSLAIGAAMISLSWAVAFFDGDTGLMLAEITLGLIGFYNVFLGVFNLLPAFPMDGGRILRATLAKNMSFVRATEIAASVGRAFAIAMAVVGIFFNLWLVILAIFIYFGAGEEERGTKVSESFTGIKVRDLMTEEISFVSPDISVRQLLDKMLEEKHIGYPVMRGDQLVGVVTLSDAAKVPQDRQQEVMVSQIMTEDIISVTPDTEVLEAIRALNARGVGRLMVIDSGRMVGIVTRTDLMRALQILSARGGERNRER